MSPHPSRPAACDAVRAVAAAAGAPAGGLTLQGCGSPRPPACVLFPLRWEPSGADAHARIPHDTQAPRAAPTASTGRWRAATAATRPGHEEREVAPSAGLRARAAARSGDGGCLPAGGAAAWGAVPRRGVERRDAATAPCGATAAAHGASGPPGRQRRRGRRRGADAADLDRVPGPLPGPLPGAVPRGEGADAADGPVPLPPRPRAREHSRPSGRTAPRAGPCSED